MNEVNNIPEGWVETTLEEVVESANTGLDAIKRAPIVEEYHSGYRPHQCAGSAALRYPQLAGSGHGGAPARLLAAAAAPAEVTAGPARVPADLGVMSAVALLGAGGWQGYRRSRRQAGRAAS